MRTSNPTITPLTSRFTTGGHEIRRAAFNEPAMESEPELDGSGKVRDDLRLHEVHFFLQQNCFQEFCKSTQFKNSVLEGLNLQLSFNDKTLLEPKVEGNLNETSPQPPVNKAADEKDWEETLAADPLLSGQLLGSVSCKVADISEKLDTTIAAMMRIKVGGLTLL